MHQTNSIGLSRWERLGLFLFFLVLALFGVLVEIRSAFLKQRLGDVGVFFRAAWAVRAGEDLYDVTVSGRWHYCYPPLLAILLTPLADPPAGADSAGMLPFPVSVAVWYLFNVFCLFWGVHRLATALEERFLGPEIRNPPWGCRRWWTLRLVPILVCLAPIGHTLMRGQVNLLIMAFLCGSAAAIIRKQRLRAGLWLSGAIAIKIIPAFLLLYPLWRRDGRFLAGTAIGLIVGLLLIPLAVFGPAQTVAHYQTLTEAIVLPGLGKGTDQSRAKELIEVTATDSQSLLAMLHNSLHLDRTTRPHNASANIRIATYVMGGGLTLLILLMGGRHAQRRGPRELLFWGALIINMLLLCPVTHLHYFCLAVPLVMGLVDDAWERQAAPRLGLPLIALLVVATLGFALGQFPGMDVLRDIGLAMYGALLLWIAALLGLRRREQAMLPHSMTAQERLKAA